MQETLLRLRTTQADFDLQLQRLLLVPSEEDEAIARRVREVIAHVRSQGDAALLEYTARWDGVQAHSVEQLEIPHAALEAAFNALDQELQQSLHHAAARIKSYHEAQKNACGLSWQYRDETGTLLGQKVTPLDSVGIYVPGGKAAYPSSVLMNAIPAHVAGVPQIIMAVPTPGGARNPVVLAAAFVAGVRRVFTMGGAQAIAALAFGTQSIARVDKITGPGNAYVTEAKRQVFGHVGIDMIAGPSEVLVLADGSTEPEWVAMDLMSQAEHDEMAQSILLCPDGAYLEAVHACIDRMLPTLPRQAIIAQSLRRRGALILTRDMQEACTLCNRIAPEHLEISAHDPQRWAAELKHAGAFFLGAFTSESLGDYCAGPNHVLPTGGTARFSSPLGVHDFQKRSSLIEVSQNAAHVLGGTAAALAYAEGLQAHARAARLRSTP